MFETTELVNRWTREISEVRTQPEAVALRQRMRAELGDDHPELPGLCEVLHMHVAHVDRAR